MMNFVDENGNHVDIKLATMTEINAIEDYVKFLDKRLDHLYKGYHILFGVAMFSCILSLGLAIKIIFMGN